MASTRPAAPTPSRHPILPAAPVGARPTARQGYDRHVSAWLAWAVIAILLAIGEILTPGMFFLGPIALAAVAAAAAAAIGGVYRPRPCQHLG